MKAINHKFSPMIDGKDEMEVIRAGKSRAESALFTDEQFAQVDDFCKRELARLGSDFPYEALFT